MGIRLLPRQSDQGFHHSLAVMTLLLLLLLLGLFAIDWD
jgi:hypothetical protein